MKLNKIWGYGQLFGYSAYEGINHYQDDHILMLMHKELNFRYEFLKHYVYLSFNVNKKITYKAIMSDFIIASINRMPFVLTFLDANTLIGISPVKPTLKGEIPLKVIKNNYITYQIDNHFLNYLAKKDGKYYKFIIHHSNNRNQINLEDKILNTDINYLLNHYINYYKKCQLAKIKIMNLCTINV